MCAKCGVNEKVSNASYCLPCRYQNRVDSIERNKDKPCSKCKEGTRLHGETYCWECRLEKGRRSKITSVTNGKPCAICGVSQRETASYCRPCYLLKQRRTNLKMLGWTVEMFNVVMEMQGGICANPACDRRAVAADHDHYTGEARSLMCTPCNQALGLMLENPELIRGLSEYAEKCQNVKMSWTN